MSAADLQLGNEIPTAAPLFVTAFSGAGERSEAVIRSGVPLPDWIRKASHIRIYAPSGAFADVDESALKSPLNYEKLLSLLDVEWIWKPPLPGEAARAKIDESIDRALDSVVYRTEDTRPLSVNAAHQVVSVQPDPDKVADGRGYAGSSAPRCYAMVRKDEKVAVHVPTTGYFYLEMLFLANGPVVVPRALLNTDLPGAFWGFTEHQLPGAARYAAKAILERLSAPTAAVESEVWLIAGAHAVLAHREFLPRYGSFILARLKEIRSPDSAILIALLGMALLSVGESEKDMVKKDLRQAVTRLSKSRAIYGETVRWLDAKFSVIRALAQQDLFDDKLNGELDLISAWLSDSFIGGQAAAYVGDAPHGGPGWQDIHIVAQKKTLEN